MKKIASLLILTILVNSSSFEQLSDVNGGMNCIDCTVIVGLVEQLGIVYNQTAEKSLEQLCAFLPQGIFRSTCQMTVKEYGPVVING